MIRVITKKVIKEGFEDNTTNSTFLKMQIDSALEELLSDIYIRNGIKFGDMSHEQNEKWDSLSLQFAQLFEELLKQNKRG